jgi:hypothetical protein
MRGRGEERVGVDERVKRSLVDLNHWTILIIIIIIIIIIILLYKIIRYLLVK